MRSPARRALITFTAFVVASALVVATSGCKPIVSRQLATTAAVTRKVSVAHKPKMRSSRPIARALLVKMNAERRARGLQPLKANRLLAKWANRWARRLLATGTFQHQDLGRIIVDSRFRLAEVGENLFGGSGRGAVDAGTAHITLMHSKTHRENVLLPQAQLVGIAAVCVGQKLIVVQDFGIKAGAPLPRRGQRVLPVRPLIAKGLGGAHC